MSSTNETIFTNARIVTADDVVDGSLAVRGGLIEAVDSGKSSLPAAEDLEGDYLIPGLIELHTDHLESQIQPRPGVLWPPMRAILSHDAQVCGAGITTVLDSICMGVAEQRHEFLEISIVSVREATSRQVLRADHYIHLCCEVVHEDVVEFFRPYRDEPLLRMVSVMDHTPGQRQWKEEEKYKAYYGWRLNLSDDALNQMIRERMAQQHDFAERNRKALLDLVAGRELALASHDDTEPSHVEEAAAIGVTISEFPTTQEAAEAARRHDMTVIMGAPNVILGGSHSGNVATAELARLGLLDALSSDYVPSSLLQGAFELQEVAGYRLPQALSTVTANPARMAGFVDRGRVEAGLRADLVRVRVADELPRVMGVWREGVRVC